MISRIACPQDPANSWFLDGRLIALSVRLYSPAALRSDKARRARAANMGGASLWGTASRLEATMSENRDGKPNRPASGYWSMHPQTRLAYEILPYLRELDGHEWTAEELESLASAERLEGRPLTEPEKRLWVAQARMVGHL
jgi:hypothetical protein